MLVLVPVNGDLAFLDHDERYLRHILAKQMSRSMFSSKCTSKAMERDCFTVERCGMHGRSWRGEAQMQPHSLYIVLVDGMKYVGSLECSFESGKAAFVSNVCIRVEHRGKNFFNELFAQLHSVLGQRREVELTVFWPMSRSVATPVLETRARRLIRKYGRIGFSVVGYRDGMYRLRAAELRPEGQCTLTRYEYRR